MITQTTTKAVLDEAGFKALLAALAKDGYQLIGPHARDGAVVYEPISSPEDLPIGKSDEQEGGKYRLVDGTSGAYFEYVVGPTSWKKYLFPPRQKVLEAKREKDGFSIVESTEKEPPYAFIGVRACELAAIQIQDKVLNSGDNADSGYSARRANAFIVAVNCSRAAKTCFCDSMKTGPNVGAGYDLALTELLDKKRHEFLVEVGSARGEAILNKLPKRESVGEDIRAAKAVVENARSHMGRAMIPGVASLLKRNLESPRWAEVAKRCLSCGNCTMACPTCFCNTVEDVTDLSGDHAERWRLWDSCFSVDFSYIHGGSIRKEGFSRYRQWMTHKLSSWLDQFGTSGCVGCGRCITWCPVGIDITEEAAEIKKTDKGVG
ncbi:MAG: 4Fe-4S dicluster domain-containing protein [Alphaproteobacteria bacterium]|nr:4Fe-4S dicluster domain-containing protein [Alphaproteobacteria bacterium]